jgi:hypothetical protein
MKENVFRIGRKKSGAAGRPFKLKLRERKIFDASGILQTVHYLHFIRISFLFDLGRSNVYRYIYAKATHKLFIPFSKKLYKRIRKLRAIDEVEVYTFKVSKHSQTLLNRNKYQDQRIREREKATTPVKRKNILSRHST